MRTDFVIYPAAMQDFGAFVAWVTSLDGGSVLGRDTSTHPYGLYVDEAKYRAWQAAVAVSSAKPTNKQRAARSKKP